MKSTDSSGFRRLDIVRAVAVLGVLAMLAGAALERTGEPWSYPPPVASPDGEEPIATEAGVFRLRPEDVAVEPGYAGEPGAHVRALEIYRRLRAYPGAPPRIPHGLTEEEFRRTSCNVCHRRGGWVARFGTYAPVTPHPEYGSCLQCHVPLDELVGIPRPASDGARVCDQCHVDPDAARRTFVEIDWRPAAWPETDRQAMAGSPHLIPHGLESRNNCLACHSGPGAVVELRTDHPERLGCRQCHVPDGSTDEPTPPPPGEVGAGGGGAS